MTIRPNRLFPLVFVALFASTAIAQNSSNFQVVGFGTGLYEASARVEATTLGASGCIKEDKEDIICVGICLVWAGQNLGAIRVQ